MVALRASQESQARARTQDALDRYPHTIVELTGSNVTAATLDWAEGEGIDILVMGEVPDAPAASTYVKRQHVSCHSLHPLTTDCKRATNVIIICTGFRDAKVKAAMTKVIPGEWGLGSVSGRTLQHTRVRFGPPFPRTLAVLLPVSYRERITPVVCPGPRSLSRLQVPLLVVRPDAALKLNKLRTQQTSMAAGSADQASSKRPVDHIFNGFGWQSTWCLGKQA